MFHAIQGPQASSRGMKIAAAALVIAVFTLVSMLIGMRVGGPVTHQYNLGSLSYDVRPSFTGKAELYVPFTGWQLEAGVIGAPYALHLEPRSVSGKALVRAAKGIGESLHRAKKNIKHSAILAFVRALLFGLAGGVVAAVIVALALLAFWQQRRVALLAGAGCTALTLLLVGGSGLWVWQSIDIGALKRPRVTKGAGSKVLDTAVRRLTRDGSLESFIQDLAPLLEAACGLSKGRH